MLLIVALFLVPFVSNRGERAPSRRPVAVLAVIVIYTALGVLTYQGATSPWSPQMTAWSGDPVPENMVREQHAAASCRAPSVFQNKNCRNCHALDGIGGRRGPDLTTVGTRLTRDQLIDQISNGTPGRRQHAGLRQADQPGRDDRPGRFPGEPAAGRPAAGPAGRHAGRREGIPMSPTLDAFLRSWPFDPWLLAALLLTAGVYLRGWLVLRRRDPRRWHGGRLAAFLGGLAAIFLALASPIEPFAALLLQVHMVQHLLLMMVAPPLLWLGAPLFPMLRGLPRPVRTYWIAPLLSRAAAAPALRAADAPAAALAALRRRHLALARPAASTTWPSARAAGTTCSTPVSSARRSLFWYPVVRPYPSRPRWSPWLLFPYLLLADVPNTVLSALLTFSDRVLYPHYAEVPRLAGLSALDDQAAAGVLMWVPARVAFLLPLFGIGVRLLSGRGASVRSQRPAVEARGGTGGRRPLRADLIARAESSSDLDLRPAASASTCCASRCWAAS